MANGLAARVADKKNGTTAVAQNGADAEPPTIGALIQSLRPELARALPKHMDADRIARIALTEVRKVPKLAECTPRSFAGALLTAAALGLEPGVSGECYLVPYGKECTLIIGYQGFAKLFWQHPMAKNIDAQAVYENDEFDYAYGLEPFLKHKPALGDRGNVICFYAVATLSSGGSAFVVLSPEQIKTLRNGKEGPSGNIADPELWMSRKTCIRQVTKLMPKSSTFALAASVDERDGSELYAERLQDANVIDGETVPAQPAGGEQAPVGVDTVTGVVTPGSPSDGDADEPSVEEIRDAITSGKGDWPDTAKIPGADDEPSDA